MKRREKRDFRQKEDWMADETMIGTKGLTV